MPIAFGSDFIRSFLDMLAYEEGDRLILCAGVPLDWLRPGDRASVAGLRTGFGVLRFEVKAEAGRFRVTIEGLETSPPEGVLVRLPGIGADTRAVIGGTEGVVLDGGLKLDRFPATLEIER